MHTLLIQYIIHTAFEVLAQATVFRDVTSCSLVDSANISEELATFNFRS